MRVNDRRGLLFSKHNYKSEKYTFFITVKLKLNWLDLVYFEMRRGVVRFLFIRVYIFCFLSTVLGKLVH